MKTAATVGAVLDPAVIEKLKEAAALSRASQHEAAAAKVEEVRASSGQVAALPSIQNNLGLEYLAAGKTDRARQAFEAALAKDATNQAALAGLGQLPDASLKSSTSGQRLPPQVAGSRTRSCDHIRGPGGIDSGLHPRHRVRGLASSVC